MSQRLHDLAAEHGIQRHYLDIASRRVTVGDETLTALLRAQGVEPPKPQQDEEARPRRRGRPTTLPKPASPEQACHIPPFLESGRCWGVACQVYALRSVRDAGIGDFEDLARVGEILAGFGADFLGVSPLHAPFTAAPERCSPFFPSNRLMLNPLLIAVDKVAGFRPDDLDGTALEDVRAAAVIDYRRVTSLKLAALRRIFDRIRPPLEIGDLDALRRRRGAAMVDHALFEAVSAEMVSRGHGAGWHGWPAGWGSPQAPEVVAFARAHVGDVAFHLWLQQIAEHQLGVVADRLRRAGMRVGLYLDLAVGVAPDGSATWSDPKLTVADVRIGSPPDMFNAAGQDWGLAPLAPRQLLDRGMKPVRELCDRALRYAGALRIDHAMSLQRLYWIPRSLGASQGAYVDYPMQQLLETLAEASREHRAIVIGEDLGVVPTGFRDVMQAWRIQSYRVLMFERDEKGFRAPDDYPVDALACVATHDTATLAGWWAGADIDLRRDLGLQDPAVAEEARRQRAVERRELALLLRRRKLADLDEAAPYSTELAAAVHRLVASTPSRLFVVQLEDLLGVVEQPNLPGTVDEHPNWRRRMPVEIEALPEQRGPASVLEAVVGERPRS